MWKIFKKREEPVDKNLYVQYRFNPKEDITVIELANIFELAHYYADHAFVKRLPVKTARHFDKVKHGGASCG